MMKTWESSVTRLLMAGLVAVCFISLTTHAQGRPQLATADQEISVTKFLRGYLRDPRLGDDKSTRYFSAFADLNNDGKKEAIVFLTGRGWCGSGGCTTFILQPTNSTWKVVTKVTLTRPPIRVLLTETHGWHDIAVQVAGGGISAYEAMLAFDGKTYPSNPSMAPAHPLTGKVAGKTVVPATEGDPLYER